jgi:hypothetical protein
MVQWCAGWCSPSSGGTIVTLHSMWRPTRGCCVRRSEFGIKEDPDVGRRSSCLRHQERERLPLKFRVSS